MRDNRRGTIGEGRGGRACTENSCASMASFAAVCGQVCHFHTGREYRLRKLAQALPTAAEHSMWMAASTRPWTGPERSLRRTCITLLNSINPFRIEGQIGIVFENLQTAGLVSAGLVLIRRKPWNNSVSAKGSDSPARDNRQNSKNSSIQRGRRQPLYRMWKNSPA
jgi:hypothetical protein